MWITYVRVEFCRTRSAERNTLCVNPSLRDRMCNQNNCLMGERAIGRTRHCKVDRQLDLARLPNNIETIS